VALTDVGPRSAGFHKVGAEMRLCKDCKYCQTAISPITGEPNWINAQCTAPASKWGHDFCADMRSSDWGKKCGPDAKLFEPRGGEG